MRVGATHASPLRDLAPTATPPREPAHAIHLPDTLVLDRATERLIAEPVAT